MTKRKHTFPCWVPDSGARAVGQTYPATIHLERNGKVSKYTDLSAAYRTNLLGFHRPNISRKGRNSFLSQDILDSTTLEMIDKSLKLHSSIPFGVTTEPSEYLAYLLKEITKMQGGIVMRATSGSMAVEYAIRAAWQYHELKKSNKKIIVSLERSYYGATSLGLCAGHYPVTVGSELTNITGMYLPKDIKNLFIHLPSPAVSDSIIHELGELLKNRDDIAALIYEPVQGAGATTPKEEYFQGLNNLAASKDILLIADEIATFGRLGSWTASEVFGIKPDIICLGKGLTNGKGPLSATVLSEKVYEGLRTDMLPGTKDFGETLAWSPDLVAYALAVIGTIKDSGLLPKGPEFGEGLRKTLRDVLRDLPIVVEGSGGISRLDFRDEAIAKKVSIGLLNLGYWSYTTQGNIYVDWPLEKNDTFKCERLAADIRAIYPEKSKLIKKKSKDMPELTQREHTLKIIRDELFQIDPNGREEDRYFITHRVIEALEQTLQLQEKDIAINPDMDVGTQGKVFDSLAMSELHVAIIEKLKVEISQDAFYSMTKGNTTVKELAKSLYEYKYLSEQK
jgi:adenosylmethionine-8-amino-7-oxononanoate aminotransferase/acyl carrier protein